MIKACVRNFNEFKLWGRLKLIANSKLCAPVYVRVENVNLTRLIKEM